MGGSVPELDQVGRKAEHGLAENFRREVAGLLGRDRTTFPGAQPISFARKHLKELKTHDYYVCEKSDGLRCLLYMTHDGNAQQAVYLIDRKNEYYWVEGLEFPRARDDMNQRADLPPFHIETILDGELLWDEYPGGRRVLKYLVFDCLMLDGANLTSRTLDKRLAYFFEKIEKPYSELCARDPARAQSFKFRLEKKNFEFGYATEKMFRDVLPRLKHGQDGLIFTCRETPYHFATDRTLLKWKSLEENSVDFKLDLEFPPFAEDEDEGINYDAMPAFTLCINYGDGKNQDKHGDQAYATMYATAEEWEGMKRWSIDKNLGLDGQIVECSMDPTGRWRFMRFRDDKKDANYYETVANVLESIEDPVSEQELIEAAGLIRTEWKKRAMEHEVAKQQERQRYEDMKRKERPTAPTA